MFFQDCLYCKVAVAASILLVTVVILALFRRRPKISFKEKEKYVVVITGCDSGFGAQTSEYLAQRGFTVIASCLTEDGAARLNGKVAQSVVCDVTNPQDIKNLANQVSNYITKNSCRLWAVVNNAGISPIGNVDWLPIESFRSVMEVNLFGVINVTKALLPLLKKTRGARIINVSSVAGMIGARMMSPYCASKHALEGYSKCLRSELKPWNIFVANINPAFMKTPLIQRSLEIADADFRKSPKEVRSQYPEDCISEMITKSAGMRVEDPIIVAKDIEAVICDKNPVLSNYSGVGAKLIRLFLNLPYGLQDLLNHAKPIQPLPEAVRSLQS